MSVHVSDGKLGENRQISRSKRRSADRIKNRLKEIGCDRVGWIHLPHATVSFSRTLLHVQLSENWTLLWSSEMCLRKGGDILKFWRRRSCHKEEVGWCQRQVNIGGISPLADGWRLAPLTQKLDSRKQSVVGIHAKTQLRSLTVKRHWHLASVRASTWAAGWGKRQPRQIQLWFFEQESDVPSSHNIIRNGESTRIPEGGNSDKPRNVGNAFHFDTANSTRRLH
jgi:hypothetical protein